VVPLEDWVTRLGFLTWPNFSKDGQYLYVLTARGASATLKIRLTDGKTEQVADLKNFVCTGHFIDSWLSLAPDDPLSLFRDAGTSDVCALDTCEPTGAGYLSPWDY
jgi:hypothetical protein